MEITYQMSRWPVTGIAYRDAAYFASIYTPRTNINQQESAFLAFPFNTTSGDDVISISVRYPEDVTDTIRRMAQLERRPM